MKNSLITFLILFLSVLSFNSKTSFGQGLKKDLGICGQTLSAILKFDQNKNPYLDNPIFLESKEEFCDDGRYEEHANYIISLYSDKNVLVYDKHIYLNIFQTMEKMDEKKSGKFKSTKLKVGTTSRIVKFPINEKMGNVVSYQIESIQEKKITEKLKLNWAQK